VFLPEIYLLVFPFWQHGRRKFQVNHMMYDCKHIFFIFCSRTPSGSTAVDITVLNIQLINGTGILVVMENTKKRFSELH